MVILIIERYNDKRRVGTVDGVGIGSRLTNELVNFRIIIGSVVILCLVMLLINNCLVDGIVGVTK